MKSLNRGIGLLCGALLLAVVASESTVFAADKADPGVLQPQGDGWQPLWNKSLDGWNAEPEYWKVQDDDVLYGHTPGMKDHHYAYTEKKFDNFELHADVKLVGNNSGVCIRIAPKNFDQVPGYQVDMGEGYWGSLWEELGRKMVVKYPDADAKKLVHADDWNHYYVRADGHHIQAWLNGVKTIDINDEIGPLTGPIGFQLTHGVGKVSDAWFKNVVVRPTASVSETK
jgi:hypothetical protein